MQIYNPDNVFFYELEEFLRHFYSEVDKPISIYRPGLFSGQIFYNTEQITRPEILKSTIELMEKNDIFEIWDYSQHNINILNSAGIKNARHVPLKIWPKYKEELLSYSTKFDFDVGFCGWTASHHRSDLIQKLKNKNISIDVIENVYGSERDKRLARCKMLLNVHFNHNYKIFEQYRCFAWLDIGKIIVSENSIDNDDRCINVDYDQILPTITAKLNE